MEYIKLTEKNLAESLQKATAVLAAGGLILYPTETVYGVGVDATQSSAVTELLGYKNRPPGKAISVLVDSFISAEKIVEVNAVALDLYKRFLPGPVTIVSKSKEKVDLRLESELHTLGVRISSHPVAQQLAILYQKPITATSANASGKARPYTVEQALAGLSPTQKERISLILDYGELPRRDPSTVIDTTQNSQTIVRAGAHFSDLSPQHISHSEEETYALAADLMKSLAYQLKEGPLIFALEGEMGVGKTHFTKGIAQALGVQKVVTSPTYVLIKEYVGEKEVRLIHIDLWRLTTVTLEELEFDQYLKANTVVVIEWADPVIAFLKSKEVKGLHLFFQAVETNKRKIHLKEL